MAESKTIGRYIVDSLLGEGAMGSVFKGHDPIIDRYVAIKTIKLDASRSEEERKEFVERFFEEAKTTGHLNHPNIVAIFDVGEHDNMPYIAMEFVEGKTLSQFLRKRQRPSFDQLIQILTQIAGALDFAHKKGVVHRDLKPGNIMVMNDGTAKIMDFGIAKNTSRDIHLTQTGMFIGTPSYSSPEQIKEGSVDTRSDIFSFGILAHETLTGHSPFPSANINSVLYKIANEAPTFAPNIRDLPVEQYRWREVMLKVLHKEPDKRYQTAMSFINALVNCVNLNDTDKTVVVAPGQLDATVKVGRHASNKELERSDFERSHSSTKIEKPTKPMLLRPAFQLMFVLSVGVLGLYYTGQLDKGMDYLQSEFGTYFYPTNQKQAQKPKPKPEPEKTQEKVAEKQTPTPPPKVTTEQTPQVVTLEKQITINATPEGATVFINQKEAGKTPLKYQWKGKKGDKLRIQVIRQGYNEAKRTLTFSDSLQTEHSFKLAPMPVKHELQSQPAGASVSIGGKNFGKTPISFSFLPGSSYKITLQKEGYFPKEFTYQEGQDKVSTLNVNLEKVPEPGTLEVVSEMDDIEVVVQGKTYQKNIIPVKPGKHKVLLRSQKFWYQEEKDLVEIKSNQTAILQTPPLMTINKIDFIGLFDVRVKIDGHWVRNKKGDIDSIPIVNVKLAAGKHTIAFVDRSGKVVIEKTYDIVQNIDITEVMPKDNAD